MDIDAGRARLSSGNEWADDGMPFALRPKFNLKAMPVSTA